MSYSESDFDRKVMKVILLKFINKGILEFNKFSVILTVFLHLYRT